MPKYVVRHGLMRNLGILSAKGKETVYRRGDHVVARTRRGLEAGEVLCEATLEVVKDLRDPEQGEILRRMTADDENELAHMRSQESCEFDICKRFVEKLELKMELVDLEHVFGGERILV